MIGQSDELKLEAYTISTGARDADKDVALHNVAMDSDPDNNTYPTGLNRPVSTSIIPRLASSTTPFGGFGLMDGADIPLIYYAP